MSSNQEGNRLQRTLLFGMLFVFLLLVAVFAGYMFLGRTPAAAPPATTAPPPADNTTPSVTPNALPAAPSDLTAADKAVYDILVGWKDNSDNEDGFNIYRQRVDVQGDLIKAGSTGANITSFTDLYTYCGETYEYIVASYNSLGESPTEVCWSITLPPCPDPKALTENPGVDKGYNFLTGARGVNSDFYLNLPTGAKPSFVADQGGQRGLLDLGDVGDVPLSHVDLPVPPDYNRAGLEAIKGHTYATRATDGESVIVSTVKSLDKTAGLSYIVWKPGDEKTGACKVGRQGRNPPPPKTCTCKDGNIQVPGITLAAANYNQCASNPNATCECHGDDLVFSTSAVYPKDPVCTGGQCACKGSDWVCADGFTVKNSLRCPQTTTKTPPPPDCGCQGTTWICSDGTGKNPNDRRCTKPPCTGPNCVTATVPSTEPPPNCYCEVANNAWDGNWVCAKADGTPISTVVDTAKCPPPVCGNGQVEGNEQCDGGTCPGGGACHSDCTCPACTCDCKQTSGPPVCTNSCTGKACRP